MIRIVLFLTISSSCLANELAQSLFGASSALMTNIFIHESGHYIAAKSFGVNIDTFAPYPTKVIYEDEKGKLSEPLWVGRLMKMKESSVQSLTPAQSTIIAAAGSIMSLISSYWLSSQIPYA